MNTRKKLLLVLLMFMAFTLAACSSNNVRNDENRPGFNGENQNPWEESNTEEGTNAEVENNQNEIEDITPTYNSITEAVTSIDESISDDQKNDVLPSEYNSGVYEIKEAGNYYFEGELASAITISKNAGNVHIYLNSVSLTVEDASAISSKAGAYVTITVLGTNTLSNTLGTNEKDKHIIDSKENLVINGSGVLNINSTKSAIASDKTFIGLGSTINASAVKHVVTADSIYIDGTIINAISCGKDVLHAESDYDEVEEAPTFNYALGFVYINSGEINTTNVFGDGIQADSFVYIKGGTFNITTTPTWNNSYVATENQEKGMFNVSNHQKVSRDSVRKGSTYAVLEESVKAIKVGEIDYYLATDVNQENELVVESENYTILIEGGTFNLNTIDDAIHANSGNVLISGGALTINTSDDGIHADKNLKISGSAVINIEASYEGIEAETIDISGGTTTIVALDDGVNATNSNLSESAQKSVCQINVSGGRLDVTVNPNGDRDGIDSNGGIKITGGVVITRGPNSQMASPMDAANGISITGGVVVVIGNALGSSRGQGGGHGGPGGQGGPGGEGALSTSLTKTQSSSKGLSSGNHTVKVGNETISYKNAYTYSGYVTVYANASATIE
ncbi:MAG: carbohydrate-binding domain-containing protein [Bacilli bacterium]|nr:carbohydrate-binding domain-containing protein [Bacilli bacterium]